MQVHVSCFGHCVFNNSSIINLFKKLLQSKIKICEHLTLYSRCRPTVGIPIWTNATFGDCHILLDPCMSSTASYTGNANFLLNIHLSGY